jgi:hypothetical protein
MGFPNFFKLSPKTLYFGPKYPKKLRLFVIYNFLHPYWRLKGRPNFSYVYFRYSSALNDFFSSCCLFVMAGSVFSISITLFIVLFDDWPQGYGLIVIKNEKNPDTFTDTLILQIGMFGQILVSSILGTILMVQHDRTISCINDFPWYLLIIPQQRDYVLLILESQKSPQIEMTFMGVLNLDTFVTVSILRFDYKPNF